MFWLPGSVHRGLILVFVFASWLASPADADVVQSDDTLRIQQLAGEWWQWALSIPAENNPLTFDDPDQAESHCGIGQRGGVWFLGGSLTGGPAKRRCTIPADKELFFPVINAQCSTIQGDGTTEMELRACVQALIDRVTVAEIEIDGEQLYPARIESELFAFTSPPGDLNEVYGKQPNPSPSVADGYWVLLEPLEPGTHSIDIRGEAEFPAATFTESVFSMISRLWN